MLGEVIITDSLHRADVWLDTWRQDHERLVVTRELEYDGKDDRIWIIELNDHEKKMLRGTFLSEQHRRKWFLTVARQSEQGIVDSSFRPKNIFTPQYSRLTFMLDGEVMSFKLEHGCLWKYVEEYGA